MLRYAFSICVLALVAPLFTFADEGNLVLDPAKDHLRIYGDKGLPILQFFSTKDLKGRPVIELNKKGLLINSKLVCEWAPYNKVGEDESDATLNYVSADKTSKKPCVSEGPIRSGISENGKGGAALFVEIEDIQENVAISHFEGKNTYLNLKDLAGKYKRETSDQKVKNQEKKATEYLLSRAHFKKSLKEIRKCISHANFRNCIKEYWAPNSEERIASIDEDKIQKEQFKLAIQAESYPEITTEITTIDHIWKFDGDKIKETGGTAYMYTPSCYRIELQHYATGWRIMFFEQVDGCDVQGKGSETTPEPL